MKRFWSKVDKSGDCWEWTAAKKNTGYGQFRLCGKIRRAHRVSWFLTNGNIPEGMCVLHKCDNPPCVNPDHLFLGTSKDNAGDMVKKGRLVRHDVTKTHCLNGHPLSGDNLYVSPKGNRACRKCSNDRALEWYQRNKSVQTAS